MAGFFIARSQASHLSPGGSAGKIKLILLSTIYSYQPMVNASLNWISLIGIILALYAIPASIMSLVQLYFNINRRADTSPAVIAKLISNLIQSIGRFMLLLIGGILFFQGWRLDPILQFAVTFLALGVVFESWSGIASDYHKWRQRLGRAKAVITVKEQPSDIVDN